MRYILFLSLFILTLSSCIQSRIRSILNIQNENILKVDTNLKNSSPNYVYNLKPKYHPISITLKDSSVIRYLNHKDSVLYVSNSFLYNHFSRQTTYNLKTKNKIIERTFFRNIIYGYIIKYKQNGDTLEKIKIDSAFYFNIDSVQSYCLKNLGFNINKNDIRDFSIDYSNITYHIQYSVDQNGKYCKYNINPEKINNWYMYIYFRNLIIDGKTGEINLSDPFKFEREE
jgi:hypothetical protein